MFTFLAIAHVDMLDAACRWAAIGRHFSLCLPWDLHLHPSWRSFQSSLSTHCSLLYCISNECCICSPAATAGSDVKKACKSGSLRKTPSFAISAEADSGTWGSSTQAFTRQSKDLRSTALKLLLSTSSSVNIRLASKCFHPKQSIIRVQKPYGFRAAIPSPLANFLKRSSRSLPAHCCQGLCKINNKKQTKLAFCT